jgi:thiamine-phosphate pyrophosphorylase
VFDTESKRAFGEPQGLEKLRAVCAAVEPFPVLAIGGISLENVESCLQAGVSGVAAIRLFSNLEALAHVVKFVNSQTW